MGRIANDLELRYTTSNLAVLRFTVAVPRPHTKDTTDWIRCIAWRNSAEFIEKWFSKGKMIGVTGVMTSNQWKDDAGKNHSMNELLVSTVEFCGDYSGDKKQDAAPSDNVPPAFNSIDEEDIPF